jgi:hypothetical protein
MAHRLHLSAIVLLVSTLLVAGCGGNSDGTAVSGNVTLGGAPLDAGRIELLPDGGAGKPTGTDITAGKYTFSGDAAVVPGSYKVRISAMKPTGGAVADPDYGSGPAMQESIAEKYNDRTTLTMQVTASGGEPTDFAVEAR